MKSGYYDSVCEEFAEFFNETKVSMNDHLIIDEFFDTLGLLTPEIIAIFNPSEDEGNRVMDAYIYALTRSAVYKYLVEQMVTSNPQMDVRLKPYYERWCIKQASKQRKLIHWGTLTDVASRLLDVYRITRTRLGRDERRIIARNACMSQGMLKASFLESFKEATSRLVLRYYATFPRNHKFSPRIN